MKREIRIGGKAVPIKETLVDKVINYFSPVKGAERFRARTALALAGAYTGAATTRRGTKSWRTNGGDADSDTLFDLPNLRERSRDSIRNNPLACGAINTNVTNVVGIGLKLNARIDRDIINMSDDDADKWESNTEREFRLWSESQDCDAARTLNFASLQRLAFRQTLENGDVFCLAPRIERKNSPYSLTLQLIEADRVCNEDFKANTATLSGGVEKDDQGAPVTYHILKYHPGAIFATTREWVKVPAFANRTGLRNVIHLFDMLRPGQSRGVPYLAPVIEPLKMLDRYTEAELMAAVVTGMLTVFVKTESGDPDLLPPEDNSPTQTTEDEIKLGNGSVIGLAPGESVETVNPNRPNTAYDPFTMSILRQIGVALELPFEILIKHFTASYSAARAALLEAWKFFSSRRKWLADNFCQVVYEIWLYEAVSIGRISAPGFFSDPILRKAYSGAEWIGPAKGMIDELKEVKAAEQRINVGLSTLQRETQELTGGEWEKNHVQQVKERKKRLADGLIVEATVPDNNPDDTTDDMTDDNQDKTDLEGK